MLVQGASRTCAPAGPLVIRAAASHGLRPLGVSILKGRHRQQVRGYRFGMWSSYLDPEFHRDIRRRHRAMKYKYAESLNRRLNWEEHPLASESRSTLRRLMGKYWHPGMTKCGSRFVNHYEHGQEQREKPANHAKLGSERKQPDPFSNSLFWSEYDSWRSQLNDVVNQWTRQATRGTKRIRPDLDSSTSQPSSNGKGERRGDGEVRTTSVEEEYIFDPITNRKVLKTNHQARDGEVEASASTFKSYRSQFATQAPPKLDDDASHAPVYSDEPPPSEDLSKYQRSGIDSVQTEPSQQQDQIDRSEEYALNHLPPEETPEGRTEVYEAAHEDQPHVHDDPEPGAHKQSLAYEELDRYRPEDYERPDLKPQEATSAFDSLQESRSYMDHENLPTEEPRQQYDKMDKYGQASRHQEEIEPLRNTPEYEDLDNHGKPHRPDVEAKVDEATTEDNDVHKYQPFGDKEDTKSAQVTEKYDDLERYDSKESGEIPSADYDRPFQQYGDLEKYKAFRFQEPDGKAALERDIVNEGLKEFDTGRGRELNETTPDRSESHLTGNFVRDFPEEFEATWVRKADSTGVGWRRKRSSSDDIKEDTEYYDDSTRTVSPDTEADTAPTGPLESALNRSDKLNARYEADRPVADSYSNEQQGLDTAFTEDFEAGSAPAYTKSHDKLENSDLRSETASEGEPRIYKILAYDSTMQKIDIAETTSVVPDQATPLTPAEVLLRLSNPTKFFPYFAPLREEGFDIVSGSGDVLVFRKVRPREAPAHNKPTTVNPIDMMGRSALPNAAAYVSPTGFVSYDVPPPVEEPPQPAFKSNIDVRREEPVFSGPKISPQEGKKKSVTKRVLIGGAWVAGISYALGVIADYFKTGGMDGKGPKGF